MTDDVVLHDSIHQYLRFLTSDYQRFNTYDDIAHMEFSFDYGSKYARIFAIDLRDTNRAQSAHSFVLLADTPLFKRGDILKAASWTRPATNFSRGSVFTQSSYETRVTWAGFN
jgi:hypothetical protein